MNSAQRRWIAAALLVLGMSQAARADDYKAALDLLANVKYLDTYFSRYGYSPAQSILRDAQGFRFKLPALAKGVDQTGAYSYFALAGDCEVSATFDVNDLSRPQKGYGASVGIAVESKDKSAQVQLARGATTKLVNGYLITEGSRGDDGTPNWKPPQHFPTQAKSGRLVLRREKTELVCLAADKPKDEPRELCRLEFNGSTITKIRVYADPGGSPTAIDARIGNLQVRAAEITGGVPLSEQGRSWAWLWITLALILLPILGLWLWRHRRAASDD